MSLKYSHFKCRSISEIYCREFFIAHRMAFEIEGLYDNKISMQKGLCRQISKKERKKKRESELIRNKFSFISSCRDSVKYIFRSSSYTSFFLHLVLDLSLRWKGKHKNEIKIISHLVSLLFWNFKRKIGERKTKIFFYFNFSFFFLALYFSILSSRWKQKQFYASLDFISEILSTFSWNIYIHRYGIKK